MAKFTIYRNGEPIELTAEEIEAIYEARREEIYEENGHDWEEEAQYEEFEQETFMKYKGITIYHIYKNDDPEEGTRTYAYGTSPYAREIPADPHDPSNETCFDVRELPFYKEPSDMVFYQEREPLIKAALKRGIDEGYITDKGFNPNPKKQSVKENNAPKGR